MSQQQFRLPPPEPTIQRPYIPAQSSNGFGVTAMVLGIVAVVLLWVPGLNVVLGVLATTFGGIGIHKANRGTASNKGMAVAGVVLGIIAIAIALILLVVVTAAGSS